MTASWISEKGLCAKPKRRFVRTTDSAHDLPVAPSLLERQFTMTAPNQVWVGDITYVPTWEGWLHVAVLLDLYSRRVVGLAVADHMRAELALEALQMALASQRLPPGLLHHSDRGSQCASDAYQAALRAAGAR